MEVYLDNSATTKPDPGVVTEMSRIMEEVYGNPSSMHMAGVEAEKILRASSDMIAKTLRCKPSEILYTSGGTESDNTALLGVAHARRRAGRHIITTCIEHPAVLETCKYLENEGYEIDYLSTDPYGVIDTEELRSLIRPDTILVSIMHTNNEIGSLQPIEEAGRIIKEVNPSCIFHTDAVQGYGKARILPGRQNIDLISISAHKFHGPRGVGFLYIKEGTRIDPIIFGGGQQKGMRSGTENVAGIYGMALAAKKAYDELDENVACMYRLKKQLTEELTSIDGVRINGVIVPDSASTESSDTDGAASGASDVSNERIDAPHIVSASFEGVRSEVLLHALEDRGIYVSSGSACSSNRPHISATLKAIGLPDKLLDSTIRFSMSAETTSEELEYTVATLRELLPDLRRFTRR